MTEDVVKVLIIYICPKFFYCRFVLVAIVRTSTRWKIKLRDIVLFLVRLYSRLECDNCTKSWIKEQSHPKNGSINTSCTLHWFRWFLVGMWSSCKLTCQHKWMELSQRSLLVDVSKVLAQTT